MFGRVLLIAVVSLVLWGVLARASDGAGPERTYVVQPQDTLWTIAVRFSNRDPREAVWQLRQRNHLRSAVIVPGQRLRVPSG